MSSEVAFDSIEEWFDYLGWHFVRQDLLDEGQRLLAKRIQESLDADREIWRSAQGRVLTD